MDKKINTLPKYLPSSLSWFLLILLLAVTAWCTRYWLSPEFGLYEDDLTFIPQAIEADFPGVLRMISEYFSTLAEQGRPFMWSWVVLLGHLGWQLGGLQGMYFLAYTVWMINILLFVILLWRVHRQFLFVVLGGLAYVLFSADTNQAFLFNAFGLQTALVFLLAACHVYLAKDKWHWFAYLFLVLVMLNYETPFWLFLAAPLLTELTGKALKRRLIINSLIMTVIFLLVYLLRLSVGESRVTGLGFTDMIITPLKHMLIGPFVSLGVYGLRPILVLGNLSPGLMFAVLSSAVIFFIGLFWISKQNLSSASGLFSFGKGWWTNLDKRTQRELRLLFAGLIMLVFAYPLTVILRPYAISGRETRVHMAAVVGAALILGSLLTLLFRAMHNRRKLQITFLVLLSLIFGFNFAFGFMIQDDYRHAWELQKSFWRELLILIPDVDDGTAVLVEPSGLEDVLYIDANTWNLPRVLPQLFVFPDEWEREPKAFRLVDNWQNQLLRLPGYFTVDILTSFSPLPTYGDYPQSKAIFVSTQNGELERRFEPLPLQEMVEMKPMGQDILQTLDTRPLYDLMIQED